MNKKAFLYVNYNNIVVLKTYMDVIKASLENNGFVCQYVKNMDCVPKDSLVVFPMGIDAFKYYFKGYKRIILWQQGATSEESYMRNHNMIRFRLLNFIDSFVMKKAKLVLFVSSSLREYYEKTAHCSFKGKSYLMPCFNESFDSSIIKNKDYSKKTFAYVGSLDLWQCFDKTIDLYKEIEQAEPSAFLKVLTFQSDLASLMLKEKGIKNYSVKTVSKDEVKNELRDISYGFIIRDDITVNRVATPTKFSSYLSAGVLPIYSECLEDFRQNNQKYGVSLCVSDNEILSSVQGFINEHRDIDEIERRIKNLFENYYDLNRHIRDLGLLMGELL